MFLHLVFHLQIIISEQNSLQKNVCCKTITIYLALEELKFKLAKHNPHQPKTTQVVVDVIKANVKHVQ